MEWLKPTTPSALSLKARTRNLRLRRPLLYPIELREQFFNQIIKNQSKNIYLIALRQTKPIKTSYLIVFYFNYKSFIVIPNNKMKNLFSKTNKRNKIFFLLSFLLFSKITILNNINAQPKNTGLEIRYLSSINYLFLVVFLVFCLYILV